MVIPSLSEAVGYTPIGMPGGWRSYLIGQQLMWQPPGEFMWLLAHGFMDPPKRRQDKISWDGQTNMYKKIDTRLIQTNTSTEKQDHHHHHQQQQQQPMIILAMTFIDKIQSSVSLWLLAHGPLQKTINRVFMANILQPTHASIKIHVHHKH